MGFNLQDTSYRRIAFLLIISNLLASEWARFQQLSTFTIPLELISILFLEHLLWLVNERSRPNDPSRRSQAQADECLTRDLKDEGSGSRISVFLILESWITSRGRARNQQTTDRSALRWSSSVTLELVLTTGGVPIIQPWDRGSPVTNRHWIVLGHHIVTGPSGSNLETCGVHAGARARHRWDREKGFKAWARDLASSCGPPLTRSGITWEGIWKRLTFHSSKHWFRGD